MYIVCLYLHIQIYIYIFIYLFIYIYIYIYVAPELIEKQDPSPSKGHYFRWLKSYWSHGTINLEVWSSWDTVDGRNPAPPWMYKTMQTKGYLPYQLVIAGFLNHQQYVFFFEKWKWTPPKIGKGPFLPQSWFSGNLAPNERKLLFGGNHFSREDG